MNLIRRAFALTVAAAMAALVTVAASACGGSPTATGPPTSGLEKKSPADLLQAAAAALAAAKSVHVVGVGRTMRIDVRIQHGSATGTLTRAGHQVLITIIGSAGYLKTDRAGLQMMGAPASVQRHDAGRWLKLPSTATFTGFSFASLASQLTAYRGPLEPKVRQALLGGKKVVVISWRSGSKLYVANTGPAYPLRADWKGGPNAGVIGFSQYGAHFHITTPKNAINLSRAGRGGLGAKVVPAPAGFSPLQGAHNGPMSAVGFNKWMGGGNLAASLHFVRGYDVTYGNNTNTDTVEVTLFQFATPADAASFKADNTTGQPFRPDPVIPSGDDYDSTAPFQGIYDHSVIATKGNLAFVIYYASGSAAHVPVLETMARQQYAAL